MFSTPRAPPASPRASCTRLADTSSKPRWPWSGSSTCGMRTLTGARRISDGSPATAMWYTGRSRRAPPRW